MQQLGVTIALKAQRIARARKNGKNPSREETGAVIHEICQDVLSDVEAILKDEAGEHRRDVDKVLGIGKIYDKLSEDDTRPYSSRSWLLRQV